MSGTSRDAAEHRWVSGRVRETADGLATKQSPEERALAAASRLREFAAAERQEEVGKRVRRGGGRF